MKLKDYQEKTLEQVKRYLFSLREEHDRFDRLRAVDPEAEHPFDKKAWAKVTGRHDYKTRFNGLGEHLPNFYLKIPTGGGKTLLACHTIGMVNRHYLRKQYGFVLWIVPSTQIYRQTLTALRNREHPYRQTLDIASAGRTLIIEKTDRFTKQDLEERLVIMLFMLPSANRLNKDTLRAFKDSGAFTEFFPAEDHTERQAELLRKFPNLDAYGEGFGRIAKTSLGNTLRIIQPVIIIDEGHRAYSQTAQDTICGFNPKLLVELSATPPPNANLLVNISGQELNREEMIKLDMHVKNKGGDWRDTLREAHLKLDELQSKAREYHANGGDYIRPICLIQVERMGADQIGSRFIHAEDAREYLITQCAIDPKEIAIKGSEKDDIEGIDLLSPECPIRFIITKFALQEGWDCPFAYVLAVLTNPGAELSITQLVGRILRQPKAKKTHIKELDESYVFCHRSRAQDILASIRAGFQDEGLGDLAGNMTLDLEGESGGIEQKEFGYQDRYKKFEGKIYLPQFAIRDKDKFRSLSYEMDILSRVNWQLVDLSPFDLIELASATGQESEQRIALAENPHETTKVVNQVIARTVHTPDLTYLARQISDIVPNPWSAYELGSDCLKKIQLRFTFDQIGANFLFIIEELRKLLLSERNRMAEAVFRDLIHKGKLRFYLLKGRGEFKIPSKITVNTNSAPLQYKSDFTMAQQNLFEGRAVIADEFNELEKSVALYLDNQRDLILWWFRNRVKRDYFVQGWRKDKIYSDLIFAEELKELPDEYRKVYVLETKGEHLRNLDTDYKQSVFELCNKEAEERSWEELGMEFPDQKFKFQLVFENEWENQLNRLFTN